MTKKILLAATVAALAFSGCTGKVADPKEAAKEEVAKKADTAKKEVSKKVDSAKKEVVKEIKKAKAIAPKVVTEPALPQSTMKDKVEEQVIESVEK